MLTRILSAAIGIVIGVLVIFIDNFWLYTVIIAAIGAIGVWELTRAVRCTEHKVLRWYCICFSAVVPFMLNVDALRPYMLTVYMVFVMVLLLIMLAEHKTVRFEHIAMCGCGALVIPAMLNCLVWLWMSYSEYSLGPFMVMYILFCAWFGDSGAYFVGTFLGKHKLCPQISPKKTVEGLIGGILTSGIVAAVFCLIYNSFFAADYTVSYAVLIPAGMAASFAGVLGDLSASVIKRQYDIKDFGNLMPGHGGVLDRFDSVLFVAPFLYILFRYVSPVVQ